MESIQPEPEEEIRHFFCYICYQFFKSAKELATHEHE